MSPRSSDDGRSRYQEAFERFDRANAEDPDRLIVGGVSQPKALVYAIRITDRLERFAPAASEAIRLAARCQHIRRWTIPRGEFAAGRAGYRLWRKTLGVFHADAAAEILRTVGYDETTVSRVGALLRKDNLGNDPDVQTLEDVVCLVFLEHYLEDFASDREEAMLVEILRKTWRKMSVTGRAAALGVDLPPPPPPPELRALVKHAVG